MATGTGARSTSRARITAFARPDSVVVAQEVRDALAAEDGERFSFSFAGRHRFKGISGEAAVHRVRRATDR